MGVTQTKETSSPNHDGWIPSIIEEFDDQRKRVVNKYVSEDRLGRGANGTVLKVRHFTTREIYALKCIPIHDIEANAEIEAKVKQEVEVLQRLTHRSIVRVHSFFPFYDPRYYQPRAYCIVMEYIEGSNLRDYMRSISGPLPKNYVMECFIKLTEVLNYMHQQGIYHFDLKPENIIVVPSNEGVNVTLLDFGSARMRGQNASAVQCTGPYMAPELFKQLNAEIDGKADMWALGCILYETWAQDSSLAEGAVMAHKLGRDKEMIKKLDDLAVAELLDLLLHADPAQRKTAEELTNDHVFKGWRVAIDEFSNDRSVFPSNALFLCPFFSLLHFPTSPQNLCHINLQFLFDFLDKKEFRRVFVELNFSASLIRFLAHSDDSESIQLALRILQSILAQEYGTRLAYQICANQIGIATLLKRKAYDVIRNLMRYTFGFATLSREFAIDNLVLRLLNSTQQENIEAGRKLYEELSSTTVPFSLYLDKTSQADVNAKIEYTANIFSNHNDISTLLNESYAVQDKMAKLLWNCLEYKTEQTPRLLAGMLNMVKSDSFVARCTNHHKCTSVVMGYVKLKQYVRYCKTCNLRTCIACSKNCHSACSLKNSYIYEGYLNCLCGLEKGYCRSVSHAYDETPRGNSSRPTSPIHSQRILADCDFNLFPLYDAPLDDDFTSSLRYWKSSDKLKLPSYSPDGKSKHKFLNKGFVLSKPKPYTRSTTVFYYEIEIVAPPVGPNACLAMGVQILTKPENSSSLSSSTSHVSSHDLGRTKGEFGYHGQDGRAFYSEAKVPCYGPLYSTGDRIGCGVLSDGSVYFTLNGIWLGIPLVENLPKIAYENFVYSSVTAVGFEAEIKFFFDIPSFKFAPDTLDFDVATYFKRSPYNQLKLLRSAFGDAEERVFSLLKSVAFDLGASLLHALCFNSPRYALQLSGIFSRFSNSSSRFSKFMVALIQDIQTTKIELSLKDSTDSIISDDFSIPTRTNSPSLMDSQEITEISANTLSNSQGYFPSPSPSPSPNSGPNPTRPTYKSPLPTSQVLTTSPPPTPTMAPASPFSHVSSTHSPSPTSQLGKRSDGIFSPRTSNNTPTNDGSPTITRGQATRLARSPSVGAIPTFKSLKEFNNILHNPIPRKSPTPISPTPRPQSLTVYVCLDSNKNDLRKMVVDPDYHTMERLKEDFINKAFPELKKLNLIPYRIIKIDKQIGETTLSGNGIEKLQANEILVFYTTVKFS